MDGTTDGTTAEPVLGGGAGGGAHRGRGAGRGAKHTRRGVAQVKVTLWLPRALWDETKGLADAHDQPYVREVIAALRAHLKRGANRPADRARSVGRTWPETTEDGQPHAATRPTGPARAGAGEAGGTGTEGEGRPGPGAPGRGDRADIPA